MGTNYYRIPSEQEMLLKQKTLLDRIQNMNISFESINLDFRFIDINLDRLNPWEEFSDGIKIHIGKRSAGWDFLWNLNNKKYYKDKKSMLTFIKSGRIITEYGELIDTSSFIEMALNWKGSENKNLQDDKYIDGLRFSSHTNFL